MDILVYAAVFFAGAAYILQPVLGRSRAAPVRSREFSPERDALLAEKQSAYDAITDIDFEYETGKLSDADFAELRSSYRGRALEIMGRIDAFDAEAALVTDQVTGRAAGATQSRCPGCGNPTSASDQFCSACGSALAHDDLCASCRSPLDPDDRFCAACGHSRSTVAQATAAASTSNRQEVLP
jgi:Double zinc ribbon